MVLGDTTILDLSCGFAGAYCTKLLAGLGARVIKVEPPDGEAGRMLGPFKDDVPGPERGGPFLYLNTAKQSVTLNIATASGQAILRQLVSRADVLVEDLAPGTLDGLRLSYNELAAVTYERLIMASITSFGQDGPYREYLCSEIIAQALGGLMYTIGLPEREPLKIGGSPALFNAGVCAFTAIMAAIWQRDTTGEGQRIDISIQEATALTQIHGSVHAAWQGQPPPRRPSVLLEAADGWVSVGLEMGVAADIWPKICAMIGHPELADDARFATTTARRENRQAMNEAVEDWVRAQPKEQVYHQLQALRSIAGHVATTADLYHTEQLLTRGFFQEIDHPIAGVIRYPGLPFQVGETPNVTGRAPLLGEHNESVYVDDLGFSHDDLVRLRERGVI